MAAPWAENAAKCERRAAKANGARRRRTAKARLPVRPGE